MTRWTVPTLVSTLTLNGLTLDTAADVVRATYPLTLGAEDFDNDRHRVSVIRFVGPYGIVSTVRGKYPQDSPTHAGSDSRSISAAYRANGGNLAPIIGMVRWTDPIVDDAVQRTVDYLRAGGIVTPEQVDTNLDGLRSVEQTNRRITDQAAIVGPLFDTMFRQP